MTDTPKPAWLTTKQAAAHLGISPERVRKLTREGKLNACRLGDAGNLRFTAEDLDAYIRPTNQQG